MTRRNRPVGLIGATILVALLATPAAAMLYTYDYNNAGWSRGDITWAGTYEDVTIYDGGAGWASEPGNGYIRTVSSTSWTPRAYNLGVFGSSGFLGDLTGQRMQADFRRVGTFATLAGSAPTVRMVISDATLGTAGYGQATWYYSSVLTAPQLNSVGTSWQTHSYDLTASEFFLWPNGSTGLPGQPGVVSFSQMLQSYSFVGFTILSSAADNSAFGRNVANGLPDYGARSVEGTSEFHIDNMAPVPEPSSLFLVGAVMLGSVAFARYRRKRG